MKIPRLPDYVIKSVKSGYISNRIKLLKEVNKGTRKLFYFQVIKGMGKNKVFFTCMNLLTHKK